MIFKKLEHSLPFTLASFVHKYSNKKNANEEESSLIPPADIAWLWRSHRLAHCRYAQYVQRYFFQNEGAIFYGFGLLGAVPVAPQHAEGKFIVYFITCPTTVSHMYSSLIFTVSL
jgi:hypothetical protein